MEDNAQFESLRGTGLDPLKHWNRYRFMIRVLTLSMSKSEDDKSSDILSYSK